MSPEEALVIIQKIAKRELGLWRSQHFNDMLEEREYTIADVWKLLKSGKLDGRPRPDRKHGNHQIRLIGRCLDGRQTRLVVGLWSTGPCVLISIVDLRARGKQS